MMLRRGYWTESNSLKLFLMRTIQSKNVWCQHPKSKSKLKNESVAMLLFFLSVQISVKRTVWLSCPCSGDFVAMFSIISAIALNFIPSLNSGFKDKNTFNLFNYKWLLLLNIFISTNNNSPLKATFKVWLSLFSRKCIL